jgi:hypothetical protein
MTAVKERQDGESAAPGPPWPSAIAAAVVMIVLCWVSFVFAPNTLLGFLSTRVVPTWRDLIVIVYWMAAFVCCCWAFVALQRRRGV